MKNNTIKLLYFSPTGTTRKVLESIAKGITDSAVEHIDLTLPENGQKPVPPFKDEIVLIGVPVYGGRVPVEAIKRLQRITANKTLAIPVVVYGNREFEDALLELKNLATDLGFYPIAGAAFIGEHSFATRDAPIAIGRPDSQDAEIAKGFGAKIKEKISALQSLDSSIDLGIPGRFPYQSGPRAMVVAPVTKIDLCTLCGTCADVCPTAAISVDERVETTIDLCIRCCACVKSCPTAARVWEDSMMLTITNWLIENCGSRKEPQLFGC